MSHVIKRINLLLITFAFLLALTISPATIDADQIQNFELKKQLISPDSFYYPFKRLTEKIQVIFFINSESKADFYKDLVQKRLAELKYIVDKDYLDQVERSTQRVSYQVGILTDHIVAKKLNSKKSVVVDLYAKDKIILEQLRDKYPANSSFWMLVQHTINSIDLNLQKL